MGEVLAQLGGADAGGRGQLLGGDGDDAALGEGGEGSQVSGSRATVASGMPAAGGRRVGRSDGSRGSSLDKSPSVAWRDWSGRGAAQRKAFVNGDAQSRAARVTSDTVT